MYLNNLAFLFVLD